MITLTDIAEKESNAEMMLEAKRVYGCGCQYE